MDKSNSSPSSAPDAAEKNFIRHVTDLCKKQKVIAANDVFSISGLKLVTKNTRIDIALHDRLTTHRLVRPLDHSILIEESVNAKSLLRLARELMETDPLLMGLSKSLKKSRIAQESLAKVVLNNMATKLTVMREQLPDNYRHSVKTALVAAALGYLCLRKSEDAAVMASVGLLHDLGDLHIDPAIFTDNRPLTPWEHRQIREHPIIGSCALEQFPEFRPHISKAVLEHHERMDGSGYPAGLKEPNISVYGRIMAVVELAVGISERTGGLASLAPILKAQFNRLDPNITSVMLAVLTLVKESDTAAPAPPADVHGLVQQIETIQRCLEAAPQRDENEDESSVRHDASTTLVSAQLEPIRGTFRRAGLTGLPHEALVEMLEQSAESFAEAGALTTEALYQVQIVLRELERQEAREEDNAEGMSIAEPLRRWMESAKNLKTR